MGALNEQQPMRRLQSLEARVDAVKQLLLPFCCQRLQRILPATTVCIGKFESRPTCCICRQAKQDAPPASLQSCSTGD